MVGSGYNANERGCKGVFAEHQNGQKMDARKPRFRHPLSSLGGGCRTTKTARIYQLENFVFSWCILALGVFGGIRINYLVTEMRWVWPVVRDLTKYTPLSFTSELTLERTS